MQVTSLPTATAVPSLAPYAGWQPVAIDVLRATTTIVTALAAGATAVIPCLEPEQARRAAAGVPGARLGGERRNLRLPGFDFGNSPREYTAATVAGRPIYFTTANGTRAIAALAPLGPVLIAALVNAGAVVRRLAAAAAPVLILCAGSEDELCLEDTVCAGALIDGLEPAKLNDFAWLARHLYRQHRHDLSGLLRSARHGRRLDEQGFAADVDLCARLDHFDRVPVYAGGRIE